MEVFIVKPLHATKSLNIAYYTLNIRALGIKIVTQMEVDILDDPFWNRKFYSHNEISI